MGLENLVPQNLGFLGGIEVREVYRKVREVQKFDFLPGDPIQPPGDRVMSKMRKQNSTLEISYKHARPMSSDFLLQNRLSLLSFSPTDLRVRFVGDLDELSPNFDVSDLIS